MSAWPRVLILADDLSGAADCGVACVEAGLETRVLLERDERRSDAPALALDTDSRHLPPDAARAVTRLVAELHFTSDTLLYKKIDSTLRGNPGVEIAAARGVVARRQGGALAVVAPAFPSTGRIMRAGRVFVHGLPLEATEIWRREGKGIDPDLASMLDAAGLTTILLDLGMIRSDGLEAIMREADAAGVNSVVCDAETDEDLARVAEAGAALGRGVIWAGSGGLASPFARRVVSSHGRTTRPIPVNTLALRAGCIAVVVGSMSGIARAQVRALGRLSDSRTVTVTPEALLGGVGTEQWDAADRAIGHAFEAASEGGIVIVSIGDGAFGTALDGGRMCAALARLVARRADMIGALVATGGETARAVLTLAGARELELVGQVEVGVPLAVSVGLPGLPLPVVTKAGAFGDEMTLVRSVVLLRNLGIAPGNRRERRQ